MSPEQHYQKLFVKLGKLCQQNGWGDPFSYARSKEIYLAAVLGHKVATTYSGADAFDEDGACEYKSTIGKRITAAYTGISVQNTLEDQIRYLKEEKIGPYKNHYYSRFDGPILAEVYKMENKRVLEILTPKVVKEFMRKKNSKAKDPRIGVTISQSEIHKYGTKIL